MPELAKLFSKNKKTLVLILGLGLILSLTPFQFAEAGIMEWLWDWVGKPIINVYGGLVFGLLSLMVGVIVFIAGTISGIATAFTKWMIDICLTVPIIKADIVTTGWDFSLGFVNMLFILVLVFIGLATILRLGTYQAQKTLPLLIIIALLINFSLLIVGFVVDIGNILTDFFLDAVKQAGGIANLGVTLETAKVFFEKTLQYIWNVINDPWGDFGFTDVMGHFTYGLVLISFYLFSALILSVVSSVFFFRIIALWVLAILAPFAFAAYVLPNTRKWWNEWWQQLIQWALIGIPLGFFMFLAAYINKIGVPLTLSPSAFEFAGVEKSITQDMANLLVSILTPVVSLVMLALGVLLSMQLAPAGAKQVVDYAKKGGITVGRLAASQTIGRILATQAGKKGMKKLASTKLGLPETAKDWKEAGWGKKIAGVVAGPIAYPTRWALRQSAKMGLEYGARQPQVVDRKTKEYEDKFGKDIEGVERAAATYTALGAIDWQGKVALASYLTKTKGAKGLNLLTPDQLREVTKLTARYDPAKFGNIVKHKPELIKGKLDEKTTDLEIAKLVKDTMVPKKMDDNDVKELIHLGVEPALAIEKAAFKKTVDALKGKDVEGLSTAILNDSVFQEMVVRFKPVSFVRKIGEEKGLEYSDKIYEKAEKLGVEEVVKTNPTLLRSSITSPGFQAIFPLLKRPEKFKKADLEEAKGLRNQAKKLKKEKAEGLIKRAEKLETKLETLTLKDVENLRAGTRLKEKEKKEEKEEKKVLTRRPRGEKGVSRPPKPPRGEGGA